MLYECINSIPGKPRAVNSFKSSDEGDENSFVQEEEKYPEYVINGVKESLKQADEGQLLPYSGIKNMRS